MSTAILKLIDKEILGAVPGPNGKAHPYFDEIREIVKPLDSVRGEFHIRKKVVGLMGPSRSGVSTLINSLIGSPVCPMGQGHETTTRPALIMYSRTPGIEVYYPSRDIAEMDGDEYASHFGAFISHVHGDLSEADFLVKMSGLEKTSLSLSASSLKAALAGPLQREPMMVVVRTPEWVLKTDQIAFIDFPGLDGFKRNFKKNPHVYKVLQYIDFLILNQSTFAGLDRSMVLFLKNLMGDVKSLMPPVWLVHNRVEAKYWRDREVNEAEVREMLSFARQVISSELGIPESEIPVNNINLGKAHDGIFSSRESLFYESHFEEFEKNFMTTVHSFKLKKLLHHSEDILSKFPAISTRLADSRVRDEHRISKARSLRESLEESEISSETLDTAFGKYGPINVNPLLGELRSRMQKLMDECLSELSDQCIKNNGEISAGKFNEGIGAMVEEMDAMLSGFKWTEIPSAAEPHCQSLDDLACSAENGYVGKINMSLKESDLPSLEKPPGWKPGDLPALGFSGLRWKPAQRFRRLLGFIPWPKRYNYNRIENHVVYHLFGELIDQVVVALNEWRETLKLAFIDDCRKRRKNHYIEQLQELVGNLEKDFEESAPRIQQTNSLIDRLTQNLTTVREATRSELNALQNKKWSAKL